MATTPKGLPYPAPTDPVASGAANIQALAQAVDPLLGFVRIYDSTAAAAVASFDITAIPAAYAHLQLVLHARSTAALLTDLVQLRFNGDAAASYYGQQLTANAAAVTAAQAIATTGLGIGDIPAATATAGVAGSANILIPGYSTGAMTKAVQSMNACPAGTSTGTLYLEQRIGFWVSGGVINRITLLPNTGTFAAGSRCTLYGMA